MCYNNILMRLSILILMFFLFSCAQEKDSVVYHVEEEDCRFAVVWKVDVDYWLDGEYYGSWTEQVELIGNPFLSVRSICGKDIIAWIHMSSGDKKFIIPPFQRRNSDAK